MADKFEFRLDGLDAIVRSLDQIERDIDDRVDETLTKVAAKIVHDGRRLAPIDSGDLEAAINAGDVQQEGGTKYIDIGTSPEVDHYAVVQHEGFRETKDGKIIPMTPGEKTRSKGPYNGYMPGKKFLENAVKMNAQAFFEEMARVLKG